MKAENTCASRFPFHGDLGQLPAPQECPPAPCRSSFLSASLALLLPDGGPRCYLAPFISLAPAASLCLPHFFPPPLLKDLFPSFFLCGFLPLPLLSSPARATQSTNTMHKQMRMRSSVKSVRCQHGHLSRLQF